MALKKKLSWIFPMGEFKLMKIEILAVSILAIITFLLSFLVFDQSWGKSAVATILFVCFYHIIAFIVHKVRTVEEHYHLSPTHLEVHRKTRKKTKKSKIPLKQIERHKLDKFLLGGYLLTKKGIKHLLFFNTKKELENFEAFIKKHTIPGKRKAKKVTKKKPTKRKVTKKRKR